MDIAPAFTVIIAILTFFLVLLTGKEKERSIYKPSVILAMIISLVIPIAALFLNTYVPEIQFFKQDTTSAKIDALQLELNQLQSNISEEKVRPLPSGNLSASNLNYFNKSYALLDKRLSVIESAIIDSPERSLALYKLSESINHLDENYKNTREDVNRIYSFAQWFMVGMFTISLTLIGLAWNILKPAKPGGGQG